MKTKLGISAGLLAAIMYFFGLASNSTVLVLIAGYVLISEKDSWLRNAAVKSLVVYIVFQVPTIFLSAINLPYAVVPAFIRPLHAAIAGILSFIILAIELAEAIVYVLLIVSALKRQTLAIGPIDDLIARHMPQPEAPPQGTPPSI
ncbi:MAG: hypothetical protein LBT59_22680 [Clostridiales bacterium]|jgi:hypothetical protein|nr:hypothetical protein [Clostridiales bacterium]